MIRFGNFRWKNSCFSLLSVAALSLLILAPTVAQAQSLPLYAVGQGDQLAEIDPVTGAVLNTTTVTLVGFTLSGIVDVEVNPADGTLWGLAVDNTGVTVHLVTIDPGTGVATLIGTTADLFIDMAFNADGSILWGVTFDITLGVLTPAALHTLDMNDGSATELVAFGTEGSGGESIAFNPNNGLIYHLSGTGVLNTDEILETWDPANLGAGATQIFLSLTDFANATSIAHWAGDLFLVTDDNDFTNGRLFILNGATGQFQNMALLTGQQYFGLTFAGAAPACPPNAALYGAAFQGPNGPSVFYTIDPATGAQTMVGPIGFERVGAMAFDVTGTLFAAGEPMDSTNINHLLTIDPCTGAGTDVGATGIEGLGFAPQVFDISFRNADGALSGVVVSGGGTSLVEFDPVNGAATAIGAISFNPGNGLAYANDDTLFHSETNFGTTNGVLHSVDPATGIPTVITALAFTAPADFFTRFNAMDVEPATGILFGSLNDGSGGSPENYLARINTGDGTVTIVGDGVTETQHGLDALAFTVMGDYTVSASPASTVIKTNSSGTITITVAPVGTSFGNAVNLSCGTLPAGVSCSFSPTSVTPGFGSATSTLTITHAKKIGTVVPMAPPLGPFPLGLLMAALLGLLTLSLFVIARRSPRFKLRLFLPAALLLGGVMLLSACGGAKPVSYSATINATSGAIAKTATVNVSTK